MMMRFKREVLCGRKKVFYKISTGKGTYVLSFRHSVVKDANGYGKNIRR